MKKHEINKMIEFEYIYSAMEILASAFDFCVNHMQINQKKSINLFLISGIFEYYDIRSPKYMVGISGRELALEILDKLNIDYANVDLNYVDFFKSKEYWAMYMLTYYKYKINISFNNLFKIIDINDIIDMYNPLHEASFDKFVEVIDEKLEDYKSGINSLSNKLKLLREQKDLTQKELSEMTGINLRTLQKYEINEKDIMKASYETVEKLKSVLNYT